MATINTRAWEAWIDLMPGSEHKLYVVGEVETNRGNLVPELSEAVPQGINPEILILDLTIVEEDGGGTDDVTFRPVRFEKLAGRGQYSQVEIRFEQESVEVISVREVQ